MRFTQPNDLNDRVQIIDLGVATHQGPPTVQARARPRFPRWTLILGGAIGIGLLSGQVLRPAPADTPVPTESASALPAPSACEVIRQVRLSNMATSTADVGTADSPMTLPEGYSVLGVMSEQTRSSVGIGLVHPDGLVEVCEDPADGEALNVVFSGQGELGALPEGMSYAYTKPHGWIEEGPVLRVAGVRLADGTVVKDLTLPDGRVVPQAAITG